ncbi:MAG: hypothetical protein J7L14_01410 [Candidatus Diapherotrites archaeon]|nr:hypothetical protein [Candidatus Diapherotrites archaeon]
MFLDFMASVVALLVLTFEISVVAALLFLLSMPLYKKFQNKFKKNKFLQIAVPYYLIVLIITVVAYFFPYVTSPNGVDVAAALQPTAIEILQLFLLVVFGLLFKSICLAVLFLPFVFIAALVRENFKQKGKLCSYGVAIVTASFLFSLLITFLPWLLSGVIYLIYWG